jgi:hypothetical protein
MDIDKLNSLVHLSDELATSLNQTGELLHDIRSAIVKMNATYIQLLESMKGATHEED